MNITLVNDDHYVVDHLHIRRISEGKFSIGSSDPADRPLTTTGSLEAALKFIVGARAMFGYNENGEKE